MSIPIEDKSRGRSIQGFLDKQLLEPSSLYDRHNQLVKEMEDRGMKHSSPIHYSSIPDKYNKMPNKVDVEQSIKEIQDRCNACLDRLLLSPNNKE